MPLRIFNNLSSVIAQNRLDVNNRNLGEVISRIAPGNRLFGTKANAAEKATSELLNSDTRTLRQASKNLNDGISLINVAESGLNEQSGILIRLREILTVAGGAIGQNERDTISGFRASIGATQNRFTRALNTLNVSIENLTAAFSVIKDADIAEELADLTKQQLLVQSSSAMVGQANLVPEGILLLLQQ